MPKPTEEEIVLTHLRGHIYGMPEQDRKCVEEMAERIRAIVKEQPEAGGIALALVGAEMAAS